MQEALQDKGKVVAAVVQTGSVLFDTAATMDRVELYIRQAAAAGAQLIVLPEAVIGGYPKGLTFGVSVGSRTPQGREEFRRYAASAIDIPGPETARLADLADQLGVHLVIGAIERRQDGNTRSSPLSGTLYCDALFFTPTAGLAGVHRKLMPTAAERYLWAGGDATTMPAVPMRPTESIGGAVLGSAICWENYMPQYRTAMYHKGVTIWCAPTVDDRDTWQATMRHVALEGRCFVLSACQYLVRGDMPTDVHPVQGDDPDTVLIGGGSVIVSPLGEVLAGPLRGREGFLLAKLDLDEITRARFDLDVVGHYARNDIFTLHIDQPRMALCPSTGAHPGRAATPATTPSPTTAITTAAAAAAPAVTPAGPMLP